MIVNSLTVDVEEWFHILDVAGAPGPETWNDLESRVERGTDRLLSILGEARVRGTFFVLGWVAERHPELVRRIRGAGHEIASHGYGHRLLYEAGRDGFREDTRRAKRCLEDLLGEPVIGYRAAGFSVTWESLWAFDVLAEEGFRYDSSIFPASRGHGGLDVGRSRPFRVTRPGGITMWEFPLPPLPLGPLRLAFSGGGYLRLWPLWLLRSAHRALNRRGVPVVYYVHPRELDPDQPRMRLPWLRRFKYYVNLGSTESKLRGLLGQQGAHEGFAPLAEHLAGLEGPGGGPSDPPLHLSEIRR